LSLRGIIPYVTGDDFVCWNNPKQYFLNDFPAGATVTWSHSSNLKKLCSYSNWIVVLPYTSVSQGVGFVKARIQLEPSCDFGSFQKDVWVGKPYSTGEYLIGGYMTYPSPLPCIYTYGIYYAFQLSGQIEGTQGTNGYVWSGLYASLEKIAWNVAKFVPNYPGPPYYGSGYIQVTGSNECGTSIPVASGYGPCGGLMAIPNPADTYVDIDIDPEKFDPAILTLDIECVLTVYNDIGVAKNTARFKDFPYRINTESWQEGVYFIQIQYDGKQYSLPVTIKH
jgi:hypothetical protein